MTQLPTSTCTGTPESTTAVEEASAQVLECPPPLFLQSGEERDCPAGCTYAEWTPRSGTGPCEAECSEGCQLFQLGNRECDRDCFTEACHFDSGDCNTCAPGCPWQYVQDGQCETCLPLSLACTARRVMCLIARSHLHSVCPSRRFATDTATQPRRLRVTRRSWEISTALHSLKTLATVRYRAAMRHPSRAFRTAVGTALPSLQLVMVSAMTAVPILRAKSSHSTWETVCLPKSRSCNWHWRCGLVQKRPQQS